MADELTRKIREAYDGLSIEETYQQLVIVARDRAIIRERSVNAIRALRTKLSAAEAERDGLREERAQLRGIIEGMKESWDATAKEREAARAELTAARERLARFEAAEEIMLRRGWYPVSIPSCRPNYRWQICTRGAAQGFSAAQWNEWRQLIFDDPTTAILEADRWAKENGL